ncbi:MAG: hypothetical protein AAGI68_12145 [Planctomycetota bacterium]
MSEPLSIKERIDRRLLALVQPVADALQGVDADAGDAALFEPEGNSTEPNSVLVIPGKAQVVERTVGNPGSVTLEYPVVLEALIAPGSHVGAAEAEGGAGARTSSRINDAQRRLFAAVLADPRLTEPDTDAPLADRVDLEELDAPPLEEGQPEACAYVLVVVTYQHDSNDMTRNQGVVTPLIETA